MEKEEIEKLAENWTFGRLVQSTHIYDQKSCEESFIAGYQKAQQEAKIIEGITLSQVYNLAKGNTSFSEFKATIDKYHNGTPETVVDLSEYVLTKNQK